MTDTVTIPVFERLKTANTVGAAPGLFGWKFLKTLVEMVSAGDTDLVLLLAAAIWALVAVRRYMMATKPFLRIIRWLWRGGEGGGGYFLPPPLFFFVGR